MGGGGGVSICSAINALNKKWQILFSLIDWSLFVVFRAKISSNFIDHNSSKSHIVGLNSRILVVCKY